MTEPPKLTELVEMFEQTTLDRSHPPALMAAEDDTLTLIWPCGQTYAISRDKPGKIRWYHRVQFRWQKLKARLFGHQKCRWLGSDNAWAMALAMHAYMQSDDPSAMKLLALYAGLIYRDLVKSTEPVFHPVPPDGPYAVARFTAGVKFVGSYQEGIYASHIDPTVYGKELTGQLLDQ
jgi:hypothetical protein